MESSQEGRLGLQKLNNFSNTIKNNLKFILQYLF